jgi:hypothetical protein
MLGRLALGNAVGQRHLVEATGQQKLELSGEHRPGGAQPPLEPQRPQPVADGEPASVGEAGETHRDQRQPPEMGSDRLRIGIVRQVDAQFQARGQCLVEPVERHDHRAVGRHVGAGFQHRPVVLGGAEPVNQPRHRVPP